ncbi:hypothetical protein [Thiothrix fructosivorans]|uniref:Uncharacterized protein n=1 Tax=Thiothrix fructosivorans TaxID=111770 RepID=A0A8B0SLG6_9GAMM|nr:hypothetical protein [Thiothrix fructosivorans]MBO0611777.1 hypothetical protein [Thiothrix fructosivorans]QTX10567.1 hypothetical protein J1836_018680 [Thiothrix fructosivorans]
MNNKKPFNAGLAYAEYKQRQLAYIIAAITAYLMSAYFVVGYFAGHLRIMEWDGSQWAQAIPSLGLVAVMTAYQFFLYSQGDTEGGKKATIIAVCVAVGFSLLSEIGQGMERDAIRMETKSQESPTYKAVIAAIGGATTGSYNPYSADLQNAEMKLAQCEERLSRGKEKHCEGAKARVEAVNKMIANGNASNQAKAIALAGTAKTMERDENNYHPLVNFIREVFGAGGTVASFLLSLTLISFFEYAFHYLGGQFAQSREYLMAHGYDVTRKLRQPPRKHDGSVTTYSNANETAPLSAFTNGANSARQTVGEYAQKVEAGLKASPEVIATEYARANYAHNQMMGDVQNVAGKVGDKLDELAGKPDQDVMNEMLKSIRTQLLNSELEPTVKALYPAIEKTLHDAGYETPKKTVMKLAENLLMHLSTKDNVLVKRGNEYQLAERWASDAPFIKESSGFKQSPEQRATVQRLYEEQLAEHERATHSGLSGENTIKYLAPKETDSPSPTSSVNVPRLSVEETVKRIHANVKQSGANSPEAIQAAVFDAYAGMANPAPLNDVILERIAEKIIPTNERAHSTNERTVCNEPTHSTNERAHSHDAEKELLEAMKDAQSKIEADILKEGYGLYEQWKAAILSGETKLTTRDGRSFVNAHLCQGKKRTITPEGMNALIVIWQARAAKEGVLLLNPRYTGKPPFPKYLLA